MVVESKMLMSISQDPYWEEVACRLDVPIHLGEGGSRLDGFHAVGCLSNPQPSNPGPVTTAPPHTPVVMVNWS